MEKKEFKLVSAGEVCKDCGCTIYAKVLPLYDGTLGIEYSCGCGTSIGHPAQYSDEEFERLKETQDEIINNLGATFKKIGKTTPGKITITNNRTGEVTIRNFDTIEVNNVYRAITKDIVKIMVKLTKDGKEEFETIKFKSKLKHYRNIIEKKNSLFTEFVDVVVQR